MTEKISKLTSTGRERLGEKSTLSTAESAVLENESGQTKRPKEVVIAVEKIRQEKEQLNQVLENLGLLNVFLKNVYDNILERMETVYKGKRPPASWPEERKKEFVGNLTKITSGLQQEIRIEQKVFTADLKKIVQELYIPMLRENFYNNLEVKKLFEEIFRATGVKIEGTKSGEIIPNGMEKILIESGDLFKLNDETLKRIVEEVKNFCNDEDNDGAIEECDALSYVEPRILAPEKDGERKVLNDGVAVGTYLRTGNDILRSLKHNFGSLAKGGWE